MEPLIVNAKTHVHTSLGAWTQTAIFQTLSDSSHLIGTVEFVLGGETSWADKICRDLARRNNIDLTVMYANYQRYDREAVNKRNKKIAQYADAAIIMSDGQNKATLNVIKHFTKLGKVLFIYDKPSGEYQLIQPDEEIIKVTPADFLAQLAKQKVDAFYRQRAFTHNTLKGIVRAAEVPEIFDPQPVHDEPWEID